jgi:hypothetical protein
VGQKLLQRGRSGSGLGFLGGVSVRFPLCRNEVPLESPSGRRLQDRIGPEREGHRGHLAAEQIDTLPAEEGRAVGAAYKFRRQIEAIGLTQALKVKLYRCLATHGFSAKSIKTAIMAIQQPE